MQRDIPDDAVEAAARATRARILFDNQETFDSADPTVQELWRSIARAALAAALPHLVAAERRAIQELHWMARRYCDGRMSTAPGSFNSITRELLLLGIELRAPRFARDGMGRSYDGLTDDDAAAAQEDMPRGHAVLEAEWRLRAAELVAAEREACAREADGVVAIEAAAAIRARGDAERG